MTLLRKSLRALSLPSSILILVALSASAAQAQLIEEMNMTIPFDFTVQDQHFDAGTYTLSSIDADDKTSFKIVGTESEAEAVFLTRSLATDPEIDKPHVVFDLVNGQHVLSEIRIPARSIARAVIVEPSDSTASMKPAASADETVIIDLTSRES